MIIRHPTFYQMHGPVSLVLIQLTYFMIKLHPVNLGVHLPRIDCDLLPETGISRIGRLAFLGPEQ